MPTTAESSPMGPMYLSISAKLPVTSNYLIDNKAGIIVDAEGTPANRIAEIAITATMIERVKDRFDLQRGGWQVTPFMARSGCSRGWWKSARLLVLNRGASPLVDQTCSNRRSSVRQASVKYLLRPLGNW